MKKRLAWSAGIVIFLVPLVLAAKYGPEVDTSRKSRTTGPMALKPVVETVVFLGGSKLEIFGLSENVWTDGIMSAPSGLLGGIRKTGSTGSACGDELDGLRHRRFELDGELAGSQYEHENNSLMLSVRLVNSLGSVVPLDRIKDGDLEVRLSDGSGGWLVGTGPHGMPDDPECRGVMVFVGWPRLGPDLVFEARALGQPAETFRLANPAAGAVAAKWTAAPLPQKHRAKDWELELMEVYQLEVPNKGKLLNSKFRFECRGAKSTKGWKTHAVGEAGIEGALGGVSRSMAFDKTGGPLRTYGSNVVASYPVSPDENLFKMTYRIRYDACYSFPKSRASIVAEGTVSADAKTIDFSVLDKGLGIESIVFGSVKTGARSRYDGTMEFDIDYQCKWKTESDRLSAEGRLGPSEKWECVVFLDGSLTSNGAVDWKSRGGGGPHSEWKGRWIGELKPGMKLELGVMPPMPDEVVEFVFDRSQFKAWK